MVPAVGVLALAMGAASGCGGVGLRGSANSAPTVPAAAVTAAAPLTVTAVVDGDTVDLSDGRRVRVLGVNSPERNECGFEEASQFARTTLLGKTVDVAADPTQDPVDQNGRSLLYVGSPDDYSVAVTRAGWARPFTVDNPVQKAVAIEAAQQTAMTERLGIWGTECAPPPPPPPAPPAPTRRQAPPPVQDDNANTPLNARRPALPPPPPPPPPAPEPEPARSSGGGCHPSYEPCVPNSPTDLNCPDVGHRVSVVGPDEYGLDGNDNDGKGCESYPPA